MKLIIYTQTYPSDSSDEQTFIGRELPYLSKHFKKIIIVPQTFSGRQLPIPNNARVENRYAIFCKKQGVLGIIRKALLSPLFYQELFQHPSILLHIQMFSRLLKFVGDAELTKRWTKNWIEDENIDVNNTLFYSFWFTQTAMGLGLLKQHFPQIKIVSRAHGYDVYEERYHPPYWPCRLQALALLDKLFLASDNARHYMQKMYPRFSSRYEMAHLGVENPGFISKISDDGFFRIISCSSIFPLKRVNLLYEGIALAARLRPQQKIEWLHFGDGKRRKKIQQLITKSFSPNARGNLPGFVSVQEIMQHYKKYPVDVFVNLSTSEGGAPVSIQEAISCGIPIIATKVGGNSEIVSGKNGILLNANPSPEEIANAFFDMIDNSDLTLKKRKGSREVWQEKYDTEKNYNAFARQLKNMVSTQQ